MAMPIFYLNHDTNKLNVSPSWWIYLLLALCLTALTVSFWRWNLHRKRKARDARLREDLRITSII